jgi:glutathionyl-hydroquinone reductase
MALGQLVNGKWTTAWTEQNAQGQFQRMPTQFRNWITADHSDLPAEVGRYHLYISLGCPWAHRTALLWKLKGLENIVELSIVDPVISEQGWRFSSYPGTIPDTLHQQYPGAAEVYSVDHVKRLYYAGLPELNPTGIVPQGPDIDFNEILTNPSLEEIEVSILI